MKGTTVKKFLTSQNINLNEYNYYKNDKIYNLDDIPDINVDMNILRKKLIEKYGENIGNYLMDITYNNTTDNKVSAKKILKLINIEK